MRFPSISQYVEAISNAFGLFRELGNVTPQRNAYGEISFCSGNYAAVFNVLRDGESRALKCYTRFPEYSDVIYSFLEINSFPQLVHCRWLRDEFYVYDEYDKGEYYPVLEMEWVEGHTLGREVARLCYHGDREGLLELARRFDRLALWLLAQDFAHGDLKQDNIMVTPQGELRLIDLDGLYVPALQGKRCAMIGSPAYQHPARDENYFCKAIDDYPIAIIALSLHALSEDPELYVRRNDGEDLLFNARDIWQKRWPLFEPLMGQWRTDGNLLLFALCNLLLSPTPELRELPRLLTLLCGGSVPLESDFEIMDDSDSACAVVRHHGLYGYADLVSGRMILEAVYQSAEPFSEGLAAVRAGSRLLFVDIDGRCRIDCSSYKTIGSFREDRALVSRDGRFGFIDNAGTEVIPLIYDFAQGFREGLAVVRVGKRYGYIDAFGTIAIKPVFHVAFRFINGVARVEKHGIRRVIDKIGTKKADRRNYFYIFKHTVLFIACIQTL